MGLVRKYRVFIARILIAVMIMGPISFTNQSARADGNDSTQSEIDDLQQQIREEKSRLNDLEREQADLNSGNVDLIQHPELGGSCDCSCQCQPELFIRAGYSMEQIQTSGATPSTCEILFQNPSVYQSLPVACANAVNNCGRVRQALTLRYVTQQITDLNNQIAKDNKDLRQLRLDLSKQKANCPDCELKAKMLEAMKPSTGQLILQGIVGGLLPALGIGANLFLGSKMIGAYSNNYNAYLQQCVTIGVPCSAPGVGGLGVGGLGVGGLGVGGLGIGGFGIGGFGIGLGGGIGVPGFGLGGFGLGGGIGVPGLGLGGGFGLGGIYPGLLAGGGIYPGSLGALGGLAGGGFIALGGAFAAGGFQGSSPLALGWGVPALPWGAGFAGTPFSPYGSPFGVGFGASPFGGGFGASPFGGGFGGGYGGGWNSQYWAMYQASMQQQALNAQRAAQQEQDLMLAQQQVYQAQQRYYQAMMGANLYGGLGGFGLGGFGVGASLPGAYFGAGIGGVGGGGQAGAF